MLKTCAHGLEVLRTNAQFQLVMTPLELVSNSAVVEDQHWRAVIPNVALKPNVGRPAFVSLWGAQIGEVNALQNLGE